MQKLVSSFLSVICIFLTVMFQIDHNRILLLVFFWNFSKFCFFLVAKSGAVPRIVRRLLLSFGNLYRMRPRISKHFFKLSVKLLHLDFFLLALINFCNVFFLSNLLLLFLLTYLVRHANDTLTLQCWRDISLSVGLPEQTHPWFFHNNRFSWLDDLLFQLTFVFWRGCDVFIVSNIFLIIFVDLSCFSRTFFLNFYFLTLFTFFVVLRHYNGKLDFFDLGIFGGQKLLFKIGFQLLIALLLSLLQYETLSVWNGLISLFEVLLQGHLSSFFIQFFQIVRNTQFCQFFLHFDLLFRQNHLLLCLISTLSSFVRIDVFVPLWSSLLQFVTFSFLSGFIHRRLFLNSSSDCRIDVQGLVWSAGQGRVKAGSRVINTAFWCWVAIWTIPSEKLRNFACVLLVNLVV